MNAIIDGKFNPKCFEANLQALKLYHANSTESIIQRGCNSETFRDAINTFLKSHLEAALGRKLEDYVEPEPWRYAMCGSVLYRTRGQVVQRWCPWSSWGESCDFKTAGELIAHARYRSIYVSEAIQFIGREACDLPTEKP